MRDSGECRNHLREVVPDLHCSYGQCGETQIKTKQNRAWLGHVWWLLTHYLFGSIFSTYYFCFLNNVVGSGYNCASSLLPRRTMGQNSDFSTKTSNFWNWNKFNIFEKINQYVAKIRSFLKCQKFEIFEHFWAFGPNVCQLHCTNGINRCKSHHDLGKRKKGLIVIK